MSTLCAESVIDDVDRIGTDSATVPCLIEGGFLYTGDAQQPYISNSWILVRDDRIVDFGDCEQGVPELEHIQVDAHGQMVLPGLVNPHWHESFVAPNFDQPDDTGLQLEPYAQGGDITALSTMFGFIAGIGEQLSEQEALAIARWSLWTQLRSGTTALGDVGSVNRPDAIARAAIELGMRIRVSRWGSDIMIPEQGQDYRSIADTDRQIEDWQSLMDDWHDHASGLVDVMPSVVGAFGCSDRLLSAMSELSERYQTPCAAHLSPLPNEAAALQRIFGETAIERFDRFGLLNPRLIAVHTAYCDDEEFERLVESGVKLCFSPAHYGLSGEATLFETDRVVRWLQRGLPLACSSDGDVAYIGGMPEAMRGMYLGIAQAANDNRLCPPGRTLLTATQYAADALGWGERIGSVRIGKQADLVFIDMDDWRYRHCSHPLKMFLIAGSSRDVDSVMIAGRFRIRHGRAVDVDERQLFLDFQDAAQAARARIAP